MTGYIIVPFYLAGMLAIIFGTAYVISGLIHLVLMAFGFRLGKRPGILSVGAKNIIRGMVSILCWLILVIVLAICITGLYFGASESEVGIFYYLFLVLQNCHDTLFIVLSWYHLFVLMAFMVPRAILFWRVRIHRRFFKIMLILILSPLIIDGLFSLILLLSGHEVYIERNVLPLKGDCMFGCGIIR